MKPEQFLNAMVSINATRRKLGAYFTRYDVWLSPTTPRTSEPWGNYDFGRTDVAFDEIAEKLYRGVDTSPFIFSLEDGTAPVSGPPTGFQYGWLWLHGLLPRKIYYAANTQGTRDMMRSTVVQSMRSDYIKTGCPAYAQQWSGHSEPWKESARNGVFLNTTQFEVGGFGMESAASPDGAIVSHTIRNTTGWSSLTGFSFWGRKQFGARGNELGTRLGLGANVEQIFTWSEPNPCH
jgi:hypothetical protein